MCPEPALLVAYLDGTLFHRDAGAVEEHIATCANCTELLGAIRARRAEEEHARQRGRWVRAAIVAAVIAAVAIVLWVRWPSSNGTSSREVSPTNREAVVVAPPPASASATPGAAETKTAEPSSTP